MKQKLILYPVKIKCAYAINRYNSTGVIGLIPSLRIEYVRHYWGAEGEPRHIRVAANFLSFTAHLDVQLPGWYRCRHTYEEMLLDGDDTLA